MTRGVQHIDTSDPDIIPARVNIHHLQLRDLLQPTGVKDKVLFVSRLQVEQADFTSLKPPTTYCTLDFQPNCLTTGCGLLAAGGQHGELALRPLHSPSTGAPHLQLDSSYADRPPAPWLLRTPTGGSINNSITIQPDLNHPSSSRAFSSTSTASTSSSPSKPDLVDLSPSSESYATWTRDGPSFSSSSSSSSSSSNVARPGLLFGDEEMESELSESVFEELAAAYGFDPASVNRSSRWRRSPHARSTTTPANTAATSAFTVDVAPIKVMVSNNDQSIKLYKLRPPKSTPGHGGRIESGLPGLSRNTTLHYSTAINHASLSPDQRTLVAVGDTPEVFIHSVSRSGEHVKIATYSASSDACFSTTWSPDGSKFAVASQDGVVSVWDVRSSRRLAAVSTSQASAGSGAARVAKFSPCGRFLAFTEHRNFWGVTDTVTFSETQRIAAPAAPLVVSGTSVAEGWVERRLAGEDRFRLVTGGEEAITRDRERRSMIHATFMREWNRAINLVDRGPESASATSASTSTATADASTATSNATTTARGVGSRGSNYFPDWLTSPSTTTATTTTTTTTSSGSSVRREDLLAAALSTTAAGYRPSAYTHTTDPPSSSTSTNISGLCWDPDAEHIYVSTERAIAKYNVTDTRLSVTNADML